MSWHWPSVRRVGLSLLALARHELRMTLRERAAWAGGIAACALAFVDAALQPHVPIVGGLRASTVGGPLLLAPLAIVFVAGAARRDEATSASDVVGSRSLAGHHLLLARLMGQCALTLLLHAVLIACSLLPALLFGGRVASPLTFVHAFVRGVVPLLFITTLAYCAVTLARNVLAAAVVAVYWLFVLLWGDFLARIFNFALTQNWPTYAALGGAFALGVLAIQRRMLRIVVPRWRSVLPVAAALLLALALADAWHRVVTSHDKPLHQDALALAMAGQHLDSAPRLPGFWLPERRGRSFSVGRAAGRVLAVGVWSPHRPASAVVLERLRELRAQFPPDQVACVAVCLSNDHALSPHVAVEGGYPFPLVTDPGTHYAGVIEECGPMAEALLLQEVPALFITDRARRPVAKLGEVELRGPDAANPLIEQALAVPVPPIVE
ncbi:MAG: hypothetical protein FJX74_05680 [Armatimonadetes bacterium]|nr:hypothetical protein [Armatimonadota bacterium]